MGIYLAVEAQKDISWQEALDGDLREDAIKALDKEFTSLQKTILTQVTAECPDWEICTKTACMGRTLLDRKRSGVLKARAVKRGFLENKAIADVAT